VRCWPPAVDAELFQTDKKTLAMRARLSRQQPERPLLLTVSRLAPEKNVSFLRPILDRLPKATLAIVGDGPHRPELERQFEGCDVHFVGYLKGNELAAAYASADAFVYASETETMGNVVLEAMACGCPVIAPRAGGIPNLIAHGRTGLLYSPGAVDEAVGHCQAVLDDADFSQRLSRAARETVADWTWQRSIDRVREHYGEAISVHWNRRQRATWGQRSAGAVNRALVTAFRAQSALSGSIRRGNKNPTVPVPAS
jgi:glycosyltransferase involved in cell wall biosynthesis